MPVYKKANSTDKNPGSRKKVKETLNRRDNDNKKWWKSHAEKDKAKCRTLHSQAQVTVHKVHKEYTESTLNLDLIKQDEYKETSKDKQTVAKQFWQFWHYVKSKRTDVRHQGRTSQTP